MAPEREDRATSVDVERSKDRLGMNPQDFFSEFIERVKGGLQSGWITEPEFYDRSFMASRNHHSRMVRIISESIRTLGEESALEFKITSKTAPGRYSLGRGFRADAVSFPSPRSEFDAVYEYRSIDANPKKTAGKIAPMSSVRGCDFWALIFPITASGTGNGTAKVFDAVNRAIMRLPTPTFASARLLVLTIERNAARELRYRLRTYRSPRDAVNRIKGEFLG